MAQSQRLTGPHFYKVLGGLVPALAIYQDRKETIEVLMDKVKGPGYNSMKAHALFSLAYTGYVHTWEQYLRVLNLDTTAYAEGSIIFGMSQYGGPNGCVQFQTDYPDALVYEWQSFSRDHWFVSVIRNALTHGSYKYSACSGLVTLSNSNTKSHKKNKTFDVTLPSVEFAHLVMNSLRNSIENVGPIGGHDPLTQMLEYI